MSSLIRMVEILFKQANDTLADRMVGSKNMLNTIRGSSLVTVIDPPLAVAKN
jgi:hypothetical protein